MIEQYTTSGSGKGFCVWGSIDSEENVEEIRDFIGNSRVVTGFRYDGSLPDIFERYRLNGLNKKIFSVRDWFETFHEKPMTLSQTIEYFDFWINVYPDREATERLSNNEQRVIHDHKENLLISVFLSVLVHLIVNDKFATGEED